MIESFAPYPLEYHYYDGGRHVIFDAPTRRVAFRSGAFTALREVEH